MISVKILKPLILSFVVVIVLWGMAIGFPVGEVSGKVLNSPRADFAYGKGIRTGSHYVSKVQLNSGDEIVIRSESYYSKGNKVILKKYFSLITFDYRYIPKYDY